MVTIAAKTTPVTEGVDAEFTLTLSSAAPASGLEVSLTVADASANSDFLASGDEGAKKVTVSSGQTSADYSVTTVDDSTVEPNGDVTVTITPGTGYSVGTTGSASVRVNDNDEPNAEPVFSGATAFSVAENTTAVTTLTASDADAADTDVGYAVSGGADQSKFQVTSTGDLTFKNAPDYENPTDVSSSNPSNGAGNNEYVVTVTATSGTGTRARSVDRTLTVTVEDAAEAPGVPAPTLSAKTSSSLTVIWDAPANTGPPINDYDVQYRVGNSGDFTAWTHTGTARTATVSSLTANTSYEVQVRAKNDEGESDWSDSVTATTDGVIGILTISPIVTIAAKTTPVTEGADAEFTLTLSSAAPASGLELSLTVADASVSSDFLASSDEGVKKVTVSGGQTSADYSVTTVDDRTVEPNGDVTVTITPGTGYSVGTTGSASVRVNDNDEPNAEPVFSGATAFSVAENTTAVTTLTASDADAADTDVGYAVSGGADQSKFQVTSTGDLTFKNAPDYENPTDVSSSNPSNGAGNNEYVVTVTATSGTGTRARSVDRTLTVTVEDAAEAPGVPAPTLSAKTSSSLTVIWDAPANTGPPINDYDVQYRVGNSGDFTAWTHTGTARTATVSSLTANTSYEVQVRAKNDEGESDWSDSVTATTDGVIGILTISPIVTIAAKTTPVTEGADAEFTLTLSSAAPASGLELSLTVADASVSSDFLASSDEGVKKVTVSGGQTSADYSVTTVDDGTDEPDGNVTVAVMSATGYTVGDPRRASVQVNDNDRPSAPSTISPVAFWEIDQWIARFGRTITGHVADAVDARLKSPLRAGMEGNIAGHALTSWDSETKVNDALDPDGTDKTPLAWNRKLEATDNLRKWMARARTADTGPYGDGKYSGTVNDFDRMRFESHSITRQEFFSDTSFSLSGAPAVDGSIATVWGRGSLSRFDGRKSNITVDGDVSTGLIGVDWASEQWNAGLVVGHSYGAGDYEAPDGTHKIEADLTGMYPYAGLHLTDPLSIWATAGYGSGELVFKERRGTVFTTELTMTTGAAGLRSDVLKHAYEDGLDLSFLADMRFTSIESKAARHGTGSILEAADAEVWLVRTGVEGARRFDFGESKTLSPSFYVGLRRDGGDAETGTGVDIGGGLSLFDAARGLRLSFEMRGLIRHEVKSFRDWGASASLAWDQQPSADHGFSFSLAHGRGALPSSSMAVLLEHGPLSNLTANENNARHLEAEVSYGFALNNGFTGTPHAEYALTRNSRDYRLGWRLTPTMRGHSNFEVDFFATRRETENDVEHGAMLMFLLRL